MSVAPIVIPIMEGGTATGIVNIVTKKAYKVANHKATEIAIPASMEDMVEEIVGEIEDEYDDDDEEIEIIKDDEFVVDGSTRLEDLNEMVGTELFCEEVDTIAGYILVKLGNFPVEGQEVETDGLRIVVEEMDKRRIEKVHVYKIEKEEIPEMEEVK